MLPSKGIIPKLLQLTQDTGIGQDTEVIQESPTESSVSLSNDSMIVPHVM